MPIEPTAQEDKLRIWLPSRKTSSRFKFTHAATNFRPIYGKPFSSYPRLPDLISRLLTGDPPAPAGEFDDRSRLAQMRASGVNVPASWVDHPPNFWEREIAAALNYSGLIWWPEVVVPNPGLPEHAAWRIDYVALGCTGDDWKLFGIEVDGPRHIAIKDALRDISIFDAYDLEVYRVPWLWAEKDPWASLTDVYQAAGVMVRPDVLVDPLPRLQDYVCALCHDYIHRTMPETLSVGRHGDAVHTRCWESSPEWDSKD